MSVARGAAALAALLTAALLLAHAPLAAQEWRTIHAARQARPGDSLRVRVGLVAGTLKLAAADRALLYDLRFRYDADKFNAGRVFDPETRTLTVGMVEDDETEESFRIGWGRLGRGVGSNVKQPNELTLALGRNIPLDIVVEVGAVEAELDLTGLTIDRLRLDSKASETRVVFGSPNPGRLQQLDIDGSATEITVRGVGNANPEHVDVRANVGSVDLDLSGAWTHDADMRIGVAVGEVRLRLPRDVGVRISVKQFLASFDRQGLTRRGSFYYSANWESATHKLTVDAGTTLANLELAWVDR